MTSQTSDSSVSRELSDDYAQAGFAKRLGFGESPALLVIDFVDAYLRPGSPLYAGVEEARDSAERVLTAAREARIPIIFTKVVYQDDGKDGGLFYRKVEALSLFRGESELGQITSPLAPRQGELVIEKQYASAFFGTSLASTLTAQRCDTTLIVGLSTSGCVRATAVDAVQHGFVPVVVREAVGDRDPLPHEANLFDLDAKYADVVSEAETVKYLEGLG